MQTCPDCGASRDGAVRFCPGCGLDYWRAAAGEMTRASADAEAAPVPTTTSRTPRPSVFLAVGGVLLLVAGAATIVMSGILPSGVPGGRPTPTTRQLSAEEALIYAFFREVRDPHAAYGVESEAVTTYEGLEVEVAPAEVTSAIRIDGDDWTGHETVVQGDETIFDGQMTLVDGIGYLRMAGEDWLSGEIPERLQPVSPFRRISTVGEVTYGGMETANGTPRYTLVITKWLGGRDFSGPLRRYARIVSQESRMEVTVDAFGVPSIAELDITVVASDGHDTLTISGHATYRISSWGSVEPIKAPQTDDGPSAGATSVG